MIRSDDHISIFLAVMIVFTPLQPVNGQNKPAYLETNMVKNDPNTNTFRVIQEQTAAMAFEWKQMTHKSFGYVYLVHDVYFWGDNTVKVYGGNIGLLEAIGQPCDVTKYRAEGYTTGFFPSNFRTYQMTYKRVPKISNVRIKLMPNLYPHVSWKRERSTCESTDSTIIFRGFSTQHLRMFILSNDEVEYYVNDFQTEEGMEEVFILFNEHENLYSLPTMAKYISTVQNVEKEEKRVLTPASSVPSRITEEIEVDPAVVNVTVKNEDTTTLMTQESVPSQNTEEIEVDPEESVPSQNTEEIEVDPAAVNVAVKNEDTTTLMTPSPVPSQITEEIQVDPASNNLFTSIFQYPRIAYILIPILVVITSVISIALFFHIKKLK